MRKIHLISITEPLIQDLALAIREKQYEVSVSGVGVDEVLLAKLRAAGCICYGNGWFPEHLTKDIHAVVLGAATTSDNPELKQAKKMGLLIQSIPEFIYHRTKSKTRVVVAGSYGKKSILSMIAYVLQKQKVLFDYALASKIDQLPNQVALGFESRIALIEGDEHIAAVLKKKLQLEFYRPQIAVLTSLEWSESTNRLPLEKYINTYKAFVDSIEREGKLIYFEGDTRVSHLAEGVRDDITSIAYNGHETVEENEITFLKTRYGNYRIEAGMDDYFLYNLNAARLVCRQLGIKDTDFYQAISAYSSSLQV
ncbi:UDP-N-acetylmuramate--alanine ligase [Parabacteroides sp. OttesenSCG-928-G07]|nr:UDP-N-acetylmuramate--alanine ligase [Parabacteroides sp. OttesenSCG-928-G07]